MNDLIIPKIKSSDWTWSYDFRNDGAINTVSEREWKLFNDVERARFDPRRIAAGVVKCVRLIPSDPAAPIIEHAIPEGARVVLHRLVLASGEGNPLGFVWRIGHEIDGVRYMQVLNPVTWKVEEMTE